MKIKNVFIIVVLSVIVLAAGFVIGGLLRPNQGEKSITPEGSSQISSNYEEVKLSHFGIGAGDFIGYLPDLNAHWARFPLDVDSLGSSPDSIDWTVIDQKVKNAEDQNVLLYGSFNRGGRSQSQTWPKASIFTQYFKKIVERYDGDGIDDMSGLKYPIKNWEILNEVPSPPNQNATPEIYADYLKESYSALKSVCSDCKMANGGIPGPMAQEFFEDTLNYDSNVKNYIDILSWHTYSPPFKEQRLAFLDGWESRMGLENKEIWYPELGIYTTPEDEEKRAEGLVKSYVYRFSKAMKVGIYVEVGPHGFEGNGGGLIDRSGNKLPSYYAYKTLSSKIDYFTDVETLKEEWNGTEFEELIVGYYKFVVNGKSIYVLWCDSGDCSLPTEITGQVRITDIEGNENLAIASEVRLTNSPILLSV